MIFMLSNALGVRHSRNKHSLAPPQESAYFGNAVLQGCYPTHYNLIVFWFGISCDFSTVWKSRRWKFLCKIHWLKVLLFKRRMGFVLLLIEKLLWIQILVFLTHQTDTNMTIAINILPPFKEGSLVIFLVNFVI